MKNKEIRCPYCQTYNSESIIFEDMTEKNEVLQMQCNKCGKIFGLRTSEKSTKAFKIPCKNKQPHLFEPLEGNPNANLKCKYCGQEIFKKIKS
jgi:uncharacterized Zn-finger protein